MQRLSEIVPPKITPAHEQRVREFEERERREAWRARLLDSGIPKEFRRALPADCPPAVQAWIAAFSDETSRGLLLTGGWGTGKTHAGCAALIQAARTHTVKFVYLPDAMAEARTFKADALAAYRNVRVLLLDDLGREAKTSFAAEQVGKLIDYRKREGKPTIITTNHDAAGLVAHFTEAADGSTANAIVSRIAGMCETVRFEGRDRRLA